MRFKKEKFSVSMKDLAEEITNLDEIFKNGYALYKESNYEKAIKLFQKSIKKEGANYLKTYFIGLSYQNLGKLRDSIQYFTDILIEKPQFEECVIELSQTYKRIGDYDKAIDNFDKLLMFDLDLEERLNVIDQKIEVVQILDKRGIKVDLEDDFENGLLHFHKEIYSEAGANFDEKIVKEPDFYMSYYYKALTLLYTNQFQEALEVIEFYIKKRPSDAMGWNAKAKILMQHGKFEEALKSGNKARELKPNSEIISNTISSIHYYQGEIDKSLKELKEVSFKEASKLIITNQISKAKQKLENILKNDHDNMEMMLCMAICEYKLNNFETSLEITDSVSISHPDFALCWYIQFLNQLACADFEEAKASFIKAKSILDHPVLVEQFETFLRDTSQADSTMRRLIEEKGDYNAYIGLGLNFCHLHSYKKALTYFNKASELQSNKCELWYYKGNALIDLYQYNEAIEVFDVALSLNPDYEDAKGRKQWALISSQGGFTVKAGDLLREKILIIRLLELLNLRDNLSLINPLSLTQIGTQFAQIKYYSQAVECIKEAIQLNPNVAQIWYNLGMVYYEMNKFDKTIQCANKSIELEPAFQMARNLKTQALEVKKITDSFYSM